MNSWKRLLFGRTAGAGLGPKNGSGPKDVVPRAGRLRADLLQRRRDIVERRRWSGEQLFLPSK